MAKVQNNKRQPEIMSMLQRKRRNNYCTLPKILTIAVSVSGIYPISVNTQERPKLRYETRMFSLSSPQSPKSQKEIKKPYLHTSPIYLFSFSGLAFTISFPV